MLDRSLARDVMVTQLVSLSPSSTVLDGMDLLLQKGISGAPVIDNCKYVGVFSEKSCWHSLYRMTEARSGGSFAGLTARDIMKTELIAFSADDGTLSATDRLIANKVSGGPVLGRNARWLGSFSEHTAMRALLDMAMYQTPAGTVSSYMDRDPSRLVAPETPLNLIIERFQETKYRRFPVVDDDRLVGQISRRDVLQAALGKLLDESGSSGSQESGTPLLVGDVCSDEAVTILEDNDLLQIVRIFHDTSARRLPVVRDSKLLGQVSRRDILRKAIEFFPVEANGTGSQPLYLSSTGESCPLPV